MSADTSGTMLNAVTVDVEDWGQSVLDADFPVTDRFVPATQRILDAFADRNVRGTFFVLGLAAEKAPQLIREIQAAGHEIQSHGYGHRLVHTQTPGQFREDITRARKLLEDLTGSAIEGYRAPGFSITRRNLWALDVLVECGYRYDSSVFPVRTRRYGVRGAPWYPHRLRTAGGAEIAEIPVASLSWIGGRLPVGGGGYARLFPYAVIRRGVSQINGAGQAATIYMHPYEFDPRTFEGMGRAVPWTRRVHQGLGRRHVPARIDRLLGEFRFGTVREVIASAGRLACHEHPVADGTRREALTRRLFLPV